ncbi:MAG TPA: hypothetical protein VGI43_18860 [Mucilaginibacter sp.]|jgi:superfamily II DNA/RNA helicase
MIFILKAIIAVTGFGFTLAYFVPGLANPDKKKLKRSGLIFISTWLLLMVITIIEFAIVT